MVEPFADARRRAVERHQADVDAFCRDPVIHQAVDDGTSRAAQLQRPLWLEGGDDLRDDPLVGIHAEIPDARLLVVPVLENPRLEPVEVGRRLGLEDRDDVAVRAIHHLAVALGPQRARAGLRAGIPGEPARELVRLRELEQQVDPSEAVAKGLTIVSEALLIHRTAEDSLVRGLDEFRIGLQDWAEPASQPVQETPHWGWSIVRRRSRSSVTAG